MTPHFFIVGAPKAGTHWLYYNLMNHPGLFLPANKEPRFYSISEGENVSFCGPDDDWWLSSFVRDRGAYNALYSPARSGQLCGEGSTDYLYRSQVAARRIREDAPDARIIVLLREPAERAHSNWLANRREGREPQGFREALEAEEDRIHRGWAWWWHYVQRGYYAKQLAPFLDLFPGEQILVGLYDDLKKDPSSLLARVWSFLEVAEVPVGDAVNQRRNESRVARSRALARVRTSVVTRTPGRRLLPRTVRGYLRRQMDRAVFTRPSMHEADRRRLREMYADDISDLEVMTGLDLSAWRS